MFAKTARPSYRPLRGGVKGRDMGRGRLRRADIAWAVQGGVLAHSSGEDARRGGGLVASIRRVRRLYQQDMHLSARHGAVLDSLGHHEHLALIEGDRAVPKLDVEPTCEHKEEIVGAVVLVPVKRTLEFGDHNVVAVVGRNRTRREAVGEGREL